MAAIIRIEVQTTGGLSQVQKEVADLGNTAKQSGGGFSAMQEIATGAMRAIGGAVVNLAGAAFQKLGDVIGDSISAAKESNLVAAQTAQVIKSTGQAAGVTAQHVLDYASALSAASGKSLFGDEQIAQSTNLLLTFTNIKGKALDAATAISVDMAQALGGAPKDAAIQLGKALNDPIKGVTALTRVGVTFSDEQKAMIKAMTEAGDTAGAQQVILNELNKEFGGSAEAAAKADGGFAQFQDRLGEMEETIGKAILPVLGQLMGVLNDTLLPIVENAAAAFGPFVQSLQEAFTVGAEDGFMGGVINALYSLDTISPVFDTVGDALNMLMDLFANTNPLDTFSAATDTLASFWSTQLEPALDAVIAVLQTQVWPILSDLGTALFPLVGAAIQVLAGFWNDVLVPALRNAWEILTTVILPVIAALAGWLKDNLPGAIQSVADFLTGTLFPALHKIYDFIAANVIPILQTVVQWLITNVPVAIQKTTDFWNNTLLPALNKAWLFIQDQVIPIITKLVVDTFVSLNAGVQQVADYWTNTLKPALDAVWQFVNTYINPILTTLANVVIAVVKVETAALAAIWNTVLLPAITAIYNFFRDKIIPIFNEIVTVHIAAMKKAFSDIAAFWNDTFLPALTKIYTFIYNQLAPQLATLNSQVLQPMADWFNQIADAVQSVINYLNKLADTWNAMKPPDWVTGHSPPPMADWFNYIADAVGNVNIQLPQMTANLSAASGGNSTTNYSASSSRNFTYAPTINTNSGMSAPMDLALATSLAGV